ncbi:MAG: hypothetical protein ABIB11_00805 [Candidatus Omnitrophota bacterium]
MIKNLKIAISLPKSDFQQIEVIRKRLNISRSTAIDRAIRYWLANIEKRNMIKKYEEGYKKKPESIQELRIMEDLAAEAFDEEDLK